MFIRDHHHYLRRGLTRFTSPVRLFRFSLNRIITFDFAQTPDMLRDSTDFLLPQSVAQHLFIYPCISCILSSFHALSRWSRLSAVIQINLHHFSSVPLYFRLVRILLFFFTSLQCSHIPFFFFLIKPHEIYCISHKGQIQQIDEGILSHPSLL